MTRSSWNPNLPDVVGVEFLGVGVATNIIQTNTQMRALRFKPQRSGEVDEIAVYSGGSTNNPVLPAAHFGGHRKPFLVELYPASGFDPGGLHTITTYTSTITASSNVLDETGTALENNELQAANDGLYLVNNGASPSTATVHMSGASAFALDQHVLSVAIETSSYRNMNIRRIDQNGSYLWTRLFPAGMSTWHMGEAFIEAGTTSFRLWTPSAVRQFSSAVGNRRLQMVALNTQANIMDLLRIHVDHIPEKRAGVAIIEPLGTLQWVSGQMFQPMVTGSAATVIAGQEYIVLVRVPGGDTDYGTSGSFDWRFLRDKKPDTTFQHYTPLDWDGYDVELWEGGVQRALGDQLDGLPSLRMLNNGTQVVDTQPYSGSSSGASPPKSDQASWMRPRQQLQVPAGTTEYARARVVVALFPNSPTAPIDKKYVTLDIVNNADSVIAGPFQITEAMWQASPKVGNDYYGDEYREVLVEFGSGIDINEAGGVRARFTLAPDYGEPGRTSVAWRIGAMVAEVYVTGTGDQTADGAATGHAFIPPTSGFLPLHDPSARLADLQVSLLSQAPEITGLSVSVLTQPVTGGVCDPCAPFTQSECAVTGIPYHRVCWSPTTLTVAKFSYYEVQRMEHGQHEADWTTVAIIVPTGSPATGAPASGYAVNCWDDWSHVYDNEVCYRVRQRRNDGAFGDFVEEVCVMTEAPPGADMIITAPEDPSLNVAFPEVYGARLPISKEWTNLDADSHVIRAVYGRDKHISFRPLERLGLQFRRRILISALCTPILPCLSVTEGLHAICHAPVSTLVVRDQCGNRWYATVNVPTFTQLHDPDVGDLWLADVEVTELTTPIISAETVGVDS